MLKPGVWTSVFEGEPIKIYCAVGTSNVKPAGLVVILVATPLDAGVWPDEKCERCYEHVLGDRDEWAMLLGAISITLDRPIHLLLVTALGDPGSDEVDQLCHTALGHLPD